MTDSFNPFLEIQDISRIAGIDSDTYEFIADNFNLIQESEVYVYESSDKALTAYEKSNHKNPYFFPGFGSNPYSSILPSENLLNQRFLTLNSLVKDRNTKRIYTSYEAIHLNLPPLSYFSKEDFKITVSDIISPDDLRIKLVELGFQYTPTIEEEGTFTNKGEIFDIFPFNSKPIRIHYFDDMVEEIFHIHEDTLKTDRNAPLESFSIFGSALEIINNKTILNLRDNLYRPDIKYKEKTNYKNEIFHKLNNGYFFDRYPLYVSSFFKKHSNLLDYIDKYKVIIFNENQISISFKDYYKQLEVEFEEEKTDVNNPHVSPSPKLLFNKDLELNNFCTVNELNSDSRSAYYKLETIRNFVTENFKDVIKDKFYFNKALFESLNNVFKDEGNIFITYKNINSKIEIEYLLDLHQVDTDIQERISFIQYQLDKGFFTDQNKIIVISEADLFSAKISKSKSKRRADSKDVFADQISTLKKGDYVIHKTFGVGLYLGIESLGEGEKSNDFLAIQYDNQDKVYVPVYKMDLVQKHAEGTAVIKVANLNSKKFEQTKARAKNSVKKLAFDLLKLQAKRQSEKGFAFSSPDHNFLEFEKSFPYEETPDQLKAIDDVIEDMQKIRPMDRLVCGDVGFGKTEVAMRAAFKAVLDNKQVAILVPTTVLAFQHFNTFQKRFKNFPVNIEFISRFKSTKEVAQILKDTEEGKIDILIGTHKLLSDKIKYRDLGLLVIDEEQRFGVTHKEKLKVIKASVDCLTLTATPIPRTLQLSFLGIKDLSIIKSAPPKRQSIKSYVIKEDPNTLRAAIRKELSRGGQLFIVHNRVHDIENYAAFVKGLVPEANILVAHGQLTEKELEKRIKAFYEQKHDILISTTIIESGIDIPTANTLIVDRADRYGLSQLHQLRGRIGRSDKKAYAYFVTPHDSNLSEIAKKRLKALQTYADLGSGFSLATNDLEIRGSGDILGAEQSGHIAEIGLELYMELLKDAINELKGEESYTKRDIEILTPFKASIPNSYIHDAGSRLKYYKRLSNASSINSLEDIIDELRDLYGLIPNEINNLSYILKAKIILMHIPIKSIKVGKNLITIKFDEQELSSKDEIRDQIIQLFMSRPKVYKLSPNFSVQCKFKDQIDLQSFLEFSNYIATQLDA